MNVYIGKPVVVSDMQGPCDSGFHIPTNTELTALYNIGVNLGIWSSSSGNGLKTYLKMPFAGYRDYPNGGVAGQSTDCFCYSCIGTGNNGTAYALYFNSSYIGPTYNLPKCAGAIIRPFKDEAVVPDGTWTALYSDKIYHNATLGLISLSSDGNTWITIADKNCGATTVYNSGDTLSEANCGKYYQWGNNYGFSWTGSITTSSTKINAQNYGPGNYYSSLKFITSSSAPHNWDTSDNQNLRGGVSQGSTTKNVELKNAYIGEYIEKTYTYPRYTSSNNSIIGERYSIYKSGYKVSKIEYTTSCNNYGTSMGGKTFIQLDNGNEIWYRPVSIGWGTDNYCRTEYDRGSGQINGRNISGDNHNGNNNISVVITRTNVNVNLNGTTNAYSLTGDEKTIIETLFDSQLVCFNVAARYGYVGPTTLTVTYEKV